MNSVPISISVAEAKRRLATMKDCLAGIAKPGTVADREFRIYLQGEVEAYEKAIAEFEESDKKKPAESSN